MKQSLSISSIQRMLPEEVTEETLQPFYRGFVEQYHAVQNSFIQQTRKTEQPLLSRDTEKLLTSCAVISTLSTQLTEFLLHEESGKNK